MSSPSRKRPQVFDDEEDDGDLSGGAATLKELQRKVQALSKQVFDLKTQLRDSKTECKALQQSDERISNAYYDLKTDSRRHQERDRKVIIELNEKLSKLASRSEHSGESIAREKDMSNLLNSITRTIEHTMVDISDDVDGSDDSLVQCPICLDPMHLKKCSCLNCGHFFHTTCVRELGKDVIGAEIACPTCRQSTPKKHIIKNLLNFDAGWERLLESANSWKKLSGISLVDEVRQQSQVNVNEYGWSSEEEDEVDVEQGSDVPEEQTDEYASTDHESVEEVVAAPRKKREPSPTELGAEDEDVSGDEEGTSDSDKYWSHGSESPITPKKRRKLKMPKGDGTSTVEKRRKMEALVQKRKGGRRSAY